MKKLKLLSKIFLLLSFIIISLSDSFAQMQDDSLSISDVLNLALKNQPLVNQAVQQVNEVEANIKGARSSYYPNLEANLSYDWIGPTISLDFPGLGTFDFNTAHNYDMHLSTNFILFDFGKRDASLELLKSYKLSAEEKINLINSDLAYQSIQIFYSILFIEKSIAVKDDQIVTLTRHLDVSKKKVESGTSTDFDVLTTQVRLTNAQSEKIDLQNALNKEKILLKSLIGSSSNNDLNLKGNFSIKEFKPNTDSLITAALNMRTEIKIARDAEKSARLAKDVSALGDRPTLSLAGSYGIKNGFFPNLKVLRGNWFAGVSANIPIFNGFKTEASIQEAEANLQSSSQNIAQFERKIKAEVQNAVSDFNANLEKLKTTEVQIKQALEAVNRAEIQYSSGVITNLDIIDADTSLADTRLLYLQALYKSVISLYNLKKAAGDGNYLTM